MISKEGGGLIAGIAADAAGAGILQMSRIEADPFDSVTVRIVDEDDTRRPVLHWAGFARNLGALFLQFAANRTDVVDAERQMPDPEFQ